MPAPFWDDNEAGYTGEVYASNPWDSIVIGGRNTPGVCEVSSQSSLAYSKGKPSGSHGARVTVTGKDPGEFEFTVYVWTPAQWDAWQALRKHIYSSDRKPTEALDVYHPALADIGIKSGIVVSVGAAARGRVPGEKAIRVRMVEFSPPPPAQRQRTQQATVTPLASAREEFQTTAPSQYTPPDANVSLPSGEAATVGP